jgi:hypothetical protein
VDSQSKEVLDPKRPIREADVPATGREVAVAPLPDSCAAAKIKGEPVHLGPPAR